LRLTQARAIVGRMGTKRRQMGRLPTIGHSNHGWDAFHALLSGAGTTMVVDVRAVPHSRFPQFRKRALETALPAAGMSYRWMGRELGGVGKRTDATTFAGIAARADFHAALDTLVALSASEVPAIMCAERDPLSCHRTALIARHLRWRGDVALKHVLGDGTLLSQDALDNRLIEHMLGDQDSLFDTGGDRVTRAYDALAHAMTGEAPAG